MTRLTSITIVRVLAAALRTYPVSPGGGRVGRKGRSRSPETRATAGLEALHSRQRSLTAAILPCTLPPHAARGSGSKEVLL